MDIELVNGKLHITHKLKRTETYKIRKSAKFQSVSIMKKPQICVGFSSRTEDNKDVLLLDYDNIVLSVVEDDIAYIMHKYVVSDAYIFTTKQFRNDFKEIQGNYHVIFLSKHHTSTIREIHANSHIDSNYSDSPLRTRYRDYVLRISSKKKRLRPSFVKKIDSPYSVFMISSPHKKMLMKLYPQIKDIKGTEDGLKQIKLQEYETI